MKSSNWWNISYMSLKIAQIHVGDHYVRKDLLWNENIWYSWTGNLEMNSTSRPSNTTDRQKLGLQSECQNKYECR